MVKNKFYNQILYFKILSLVNIQLNKSFDYQKNSLRIGEMKYLNVFRVTEKIKTPVKGVYVRFEALQVNNKSNRRAVLQSIIRTLCRKGLDACVASKELSNSFDVAIIRVNAQEAWRALAGYSNLHPRIIETNEINEEMLNSAWQNRVRLHLAKKGFLKVGDRYVLGGDIRDGSTVYKRSFRVQSRVINGYPSLYIDSRTRIMIPLKPELIDKAEKAGEESDVKVRVLPHWKGGILQGKTGYRTGEMDIPFGNRSVKATEYWNQRYGIFVKPDEEMLDVYIPDYEKTLPYPSSCVFSEFQMGTSLPSYLKKPPNIRVKEAIDFIKNYIPEVHFAGQRFVLQGPTSVREMGYAEHSFLPQSKLQVIVGGYNTSTIRNLHSSLKKYGPYAGKIDGRYIVLYPGEDAKDIQQALRNIEGAYSDLGLGRLQIYTNIGDGGLISTGGDSVIDYTSTITRLRSEWDLLRERFLTLVILPEMHSTEVYYKAREKLFERFFGSSPIPTQAISIKTVEDLLNEERRYPIAVNIAAQCYVKLGGTGSALWVLNEAADSHIPRIKPGSSCYAYHDVSRRSKIKASVTAYSAMTDSYGRYIATGTRPVGGEKLTPEVFYDILVDLLQKISAFSQRYREMDRSRSFEFRRLVFAKDGVIRRDEAEMMEDVIINGIPEEGRQPIAEILKRDSFLPNDLVIDIIGVNKSPNKRVLDYYDGKYHNVPEGTGISYNEREGLLVSFYATMGTAQPIEIKIHKHICLNRGAVPTPHISQIMDEYYRLTFLDWASVFRQGKYALPQILTQNLGENISAGVMVPEDMILL